MLNHLQMTNCSQNRTGHIVNLADCSDVGQATYLKEGDRREEEAPVPVCLPRGCYVFDYGVDLTCPESTVRALPSAKPTDVDTIDHIVAAAYDVISGPARSRDWQRLRSLYFPDARLIASERDTTGKIALTNLSVEQYIDRVKPSWEKRGFFEHAVANRVEVWGQIAHMWSTYESRHQENESPFMRGINSIQLVNDGGRWWIVTVYWEREDAKQSLPEKYLH